jgi:hypothetical protein
MTTCRYATASSDACDSGPNYLIRLILERLIEHGIT